MATKKFQAKCPKCGHSGAVEEFTAGPLAELIDRFPPELQSLVPVYLGLWAEDGKQITARKAEALLNELLEMRVSFTFKGKHYLPQIPNWVTAFNSVERGITRRPLTSHNYLKQCLITAIAKSNPAAESPARPAKAAENLSDYRRYVEECRSKGVTPKPKAVWEQLTTPGEKP